jgi:hypothetical protein
MFNSDKYLSVKWLKGGRVYPGSTVSALSMKSAAISFSRYGRIFPA